MRARVMTVRRSHQAWWRPIAAAAVVALAISGTWLSQFDGPDSPMPAPPTPPVAGSRPVAPAFRLVLEKPGIELPPSALVIRSGDSDPYATALSAALDPFRHDDYSQAIQRLAPLQSSHASEPFVNYYLGVSYLLAGRAADAVAPLDRARGLARETWLHLDASWYLAVALERVGRRDGAAAVLTELCGTGGARRQQACAALGTLLVPRIGWRTTGGKVSTALLADADLSDRGPWRDARRPVD